MNALIKELKENQQDFEFYPTTKEMLNLIYQHMTHLFDRRPPRRKLLDIGCGTCNFKKYYEDFIEKKAKS